jgi:GTP:adenosylcobinamide-phosphate guanylyltransferase
MTAGGCLKEDDPLYLETGIAKKALIPIAGKTMVQWVTDHLLASPHIDGLVIVGLNENEVQTTGKPLYFARDHGGIVDNVLAGIEVVKQLNPPGSKILLSSSDIPLFTTPMVDEFIELCLKEDYDIYYTVVEQNVMEARFPNSKRTFTPMKGGRYAGGDVLMIDTRAVNPNVDLFRTATGYRKNFLQQARLIGFVFIFRFLFRLMDISEAEKRASKALNVRGRVLEYPRAEIGMDVDKLHHFELVRRELEASLT